jgi:hypothetical protein
MRRHLICSGVLAVGAALAAFFGSVGPVWP